MSSLSPISLHKKYKLYLSMCIILTLAALAEPVATGGRLVVIGVVALGTGLFLLAEAVVGEGCLAEVASPLVERVDGRGLVEFGLVEPTSSW